MPLPAELSAALDHPRFPSMRAIRQNFEIDARPTPQRWERYLSALNAARIADEGGADRIAVLNSGRIGHRNYLATHIDLAPNDERIPDTFDPELNGLSLVPPFARRKVLIRLEIVDWVCDTPRIAARHKLTSTADLIRELQKSKDSNPQIKRVANRNLKRFIQVWNSERHKRPMFAAFYDEVKNEAEADDWLDQLRIRLGLGHIHPRPGKTLAVLQMRYTVKDVLAKVSIEQQKTAFAVPTIMDGPVNPYFFTTPPKLCSGKALCLDSSPMSNYLLSEILHRRLDYKINHIKKFQLVDTPPPNVHLVNRRNEHLNCLRRESGQPDYGFTL